MRQRCLWFLESSEEFESFSALPFTSSAISCLRNRTRNEIIHVEAWHNKAQNIGSEVLSLGTGTVMTLTELSR